MKLRTRIIICLVAAAFIAIGCFCPSGIAFVKGGLTLGAACFIFGALSGLLAFADKIFDVICRWVDSTNVPHRVDPNDLDVPTPDDIRRRRLPSEGLPYYSDGNRHYTERHLD